MVVEVLDICGVFGASILGYPLPQLDYVLSIKWDLSLHHQIHHNAK